jgi:1-acyl-sn-glycerol-3-phosphate acyltransferase
MLRERGLVRYYLSADAKCTLIGPIRGLIRLIVFAVVFSGVSISSIVRRALTIGSERNRNQVRRRKRRGALLVRASGVRVKRFGTLPERATYFVANHLSWMDSFIFLAELGPCFVVNRPWERIPVLSTALRANGAVFIDRASLRDASAAGLAIRKRAARGECCMFFPEADTTRGAAVLPFRAGLFEPAARESVPVWWAALRYETPAGWPPASVAASWADWTPILLHMYRAFHVPRLTAEVRYGSTPVRADHRKHLAARLHDAVSCEFRPMDQVAPEDLARIHVPPRRPPPKF